MGKIRYPLKLDYVPDWGEWEVLRELVSNALDAGGEESLSIEVDAKGTLVITNTMGEIELDHLLIGAHDGAEGTRGQHGEGLKLALLVLTRMRLTAHIRTNGLHLWNSRGRIAKSQVLVINWQETESPVVGTEIRIEGWGKRSLYLRRFVLSGDPRILTSVDKRGLVIEPDAEDGPSIYSQGVWVEPREDAEFSYSLKINVGRDRKTMSSVDIQNGMTSLWNAISNPVLLERFYRAVEAEKAEGQVRFSYRGPAARVQKAHVAALQAVYGAKAVVQTNPEMGREANYRGAAVIPQHQAGGYQMRTFIMKALGTDEQYVLDQQAQRHVKKSLSELEKPQRMTIRLLRKLAKRAGGTSFAAKRIYAALLPTHCAARRHGDDIMIGLKGLQGWYDEADIIASYLHEEAHRQYNTADDTADHASKIARIAGRIILSYCRREVVHYR